MNFSKFTILSLSETSDQTNILINLDHIVSIKPIKIKDAYQNLIDGFWIRLSNGKKYKALRIPSDVSDLFSEELPQPRVSDEAVHTLNLQ